MSKQDDLKARFKKLLEAGLTQADALEVLHFHGETFPAYAEMVDTDDELEVDAYPLYSRSADGGVWVGTWSWVSDETVKG